MAPTDANGRKAGAHWHPHAVMVTKTDKVRTHVHPQMHAGACGCLPLTTQGRPQAPVGTHGRPPEASGKRVTGKANDYWRLLRTMCSPTCTRGRLRALMDNSPGQRPRGVLDPQYLFNCYLYSCSRRRVYPPPPPLLPAALDLAIPPAMTLQRTLQRTLQ